MWIFTGKAKASINSQKLVEIIREFMIEENFDHVITHPYRSDDPFTYKVIALNFERKDSHYVTSCVALLSSLIIVRSIYVNAVSRAKQRITGVEMAFLINGLYLFHSRTRKYKQICETFLYSFYLTRSKQ